ncbi:MAG TPA: hypothetical protein VKZ92_08655 [Pseudohongiella sp.]|nr:hypothetical protein [Pseudohongiella sp.]
MAKLTINSHLRDAVAVTGKELPKGGQMEIEAKSVMALIRALDQMYPGCGPSLTAAAVSIDGDIYTDALTEPLDELSEVVFLPSIEGG